MTMTIVLFGGVLFAASARAQTVFYTYDTGPNGIGHLTARSDQSGTVAYSYDSMGRLIRSDQTVNSTTYTIQFGYDQAGRLQEVVYPDNNVGFTSKAEYGYNGPFIDHIDDGGTPPFSYAKYGGYSALGQPGTVVYGNGVTTTYSYSTSNNQDCPYETYRLCTITTSDGSSNPVTYLQQRYAYDAVGNVTAVVDPVNGNQGFAYDELNRLTAAAGPYGTLNYLYDQVGNMTYNSSVIYGNASVGFYTYPPGGVSSVHPHAVITAGTNTYTYDNNGHMLTGTNLITDDSRTMTYGPDGRLACEADGSNGQVRCQSDPGSVTTFVYDDGGNRVLKTVNGVSTIYIGRLYECAGGSCMKYVVSGDRQIASVVASTPASTSVNFLHTDLFDSTAVVTNQTGVSSPALIYLPYGAPPPPYHSSQSPSGVEQQFRGGTLDATWLYLFGTQYYDAVLTRFTAPVEASAGLTDPQSLNPYSFMNDNPLSVPDPLKTPPVNVH
ncbi:MAG TPA: hypothetical protein VLY45_00980 [Nitrospiria bacterium]|nr:hypothetical protein [Nitrospiria bacterium]